jgi:hypothetical protein
LVVTVSMRALISLLPAAASCDHEGISPHRISSARGSPLGATIVSTSSVGAMLYRCVPASPGNGTLKRSFSS